MNYMHNGIFLSCNCDLRDTMSLPAWLKAKHAQGMHI